MTAMLSVVAVILLEAESPDGGALARDAIVSFPATTYFRTQHDDQQNEYRGSGQVITLSPYQMDARAVDSTAYDNCVRQRACAPLAHPRADALAKVRWAEAERYCGSLGKRLPTSAELEYAMASSLGLDVRGPGTRTDPWMEWRGGDSMGFAHAGEGRQSAEWAFDWYEPNVDAKGQVQTVKDPLGPPRGCMRVARAFQRSSVYLPDGGRDQFVTLFRFGEQPVGTSLSEAAEHYFRCASSQAPAPRLSAAMDPDEDCDYLAQSKAVDRRKLTATWAWPLLPLLSALTILFAAVRTSWKRALRRLVAMAIGGIGLGVGTALIVKKALLASPGTDSDVSAATGVFVFWLTSMAGIVATFIGLTISVPLSDRWAGDEAPKSALRSFLGALAGSLAAVLWIYLIREPNEDAAIQFFKAVSDPARAAGVALAMLAGALLANRGGGNVKEMSL